MVTIESIIKRLGQLGYVATEEDRDIIEFELEKILNYVKNYCNITEIPEILEPRIVDRVSGEFLFYQKNSGNLTGFDYDAVIKSRKVTPILSTLLGKKQTHQNPVLIQW